MTETAHSSIILSLRDKVQKRRLSIKGILITSYQGDEIKKVKTKLNREFEMKDMGTTKRILGILTYMF